MCAKRFPTAGFLFTLLAGSLLHFVYGWSGENRLIAAFSPVNESTWEHLKLLFYPALLFSAAEYLFSGRRCCAFWPARLTGILTGMAAITASFYTYTGILGYDVFWLDILCFAAGCFLCFFVSQKLSAEPNRPESLSSLEHPLCRRSLCILSLLLLFLLIVLFTVFTFAPLHLPLFQDPVSGSFGLPG